MAVNDEREARMLLTALSEPGDLVTGTLLARVGAIETVQLITSGERLPNGLDPVEGELWRRRLATRIDPGQVDRMLAATERHSLSFLTPEDVTWPGELQQLGASAPIALWLQGDPRPLSVRLPGRVTIVGAREATAYGTRVVTELASELASRGRTVLSGGADGIDGFAHRAATEADPGSTIAVLACGLDQLHPAGPAHLFEHIEQTGGLLVSELPPGSAPSRWRLVQRNRLLATLSAATVVVEADAQSGSLNVAGQAHALRRPVGAVPGPVTSAATAGCHRLIQEGIASLIIDAQDVTDLLDSAVGFAGDRTFTYSPTRRISRTGADLRF
ncbi:DNA-protecting protein DprA [Cryobacterium melibiosiphilum]|uniref:DNA-protecting protein DprA n=1 Tax=Cryobacterium melibiosiphilum TaxID=995039 RepID=A0A3A5MNT7_9MICO|nr:DNA-processing protein DprA [Cryobacterium melibiosiphilum]RJT91757.1 DNA-protecting protein DprA [Cryobacterium melibiosiphilum]